MNQNELTILGVLIKDNTLIPNFLCNTSIDDFTSYECREVYKTINNLFMKNEIIDLNSISNSYDNIEILCNMVDSVTTTQSYKNNLKILKSNTAKRKMLKITKDIQNEINNNSLMDVESFRSECIDKLNFETGFKKVVDSPVINYMNSFLKDIKKTKKEPIISTGFNKFNNILGGGLYPGLYVIGAISSLGKTALVLQMADQIAANDHKVLYFSLEMSKTELLSRSISRQLFKIDQERFKNHGTLSIMRGDFSYCMDEINQAFLNYEPTAKNLTIDKCGFKTTIDNIKTKVKAYITETGKKPTVIVDYLQILKADGRTDKQMIDNVVFGLKEISVDFSIPVIAVSSFNRASYSTKVGFECFKESGAIEYTADVIIGLQLSILNTLNLSDKNQSKTKDLIDNAKGENPRNITAVVLKQRNGKAYAKQNFTFYPVNNFIMEV